MVKKKFKLKPNIGWKSLIIIGVACILLAADLLTKVFEEEYNWQFIIIKGFAEIESNHRNTGIAFSWFNFNPSIGQPLIIASTCLMIILVFCVFIFLPERFTLLKIATAMVFSGAVGNLIDRCVFLYVRDWFGLNLFGIMAYCNLADFWIVIGTVLAIFDMMFLVDFAVIPLTKEAKRVQAIRKAQEQAEKQETDDSYIEYEETVIQNNMQEDIIADAEKSDSQEE